MAMTAVPPTWDLSPYFSGTASREFAAAFESLGADVARLGALYDRFDVRDGAADPAGRPVDDAAVAVFEDVMEATNGVLEQVRLVATYVNLLVAADATDDAASGMMSRVQAVLAALPPLTARFDAWVTSFAGGAAALAAASPVAADHEHRLRKAERSAEHQMSEAEEALAAELRLTGSNAWAQLWGDVTSRLTADVEGRGPLPMTVVRGLATDPSAAVRVAAYDAELAAWDSVAVTMAACMNGIKGEAVVLNRRRDWASALEPSLHANSVDAETLAAMQRACVAAFPDFRRYLRAKATLLGSAGPGGGLPWWDLYAPVVGGAAVTPTWEQGTAAVVDAFGAYSPQLRALAERAFAERWVDAEPRPGKRGGAFCAGPRGDESRILMTWSGSFDSVSTLAHELGHAYHNTTLATRTSMQRQLPMALAETASIFCETVLVQAGLARARAAGDRDAQLLLLENDLAGATLTIVDIHSRFLFETEVLERRERGVLSVDELCELMVGAQLATYGDGLDPDALHRHMWAVKPHYYATHFYNWPYAFGLLFGMGLYARYTADPDRFRLGYDDLLSSVGMGDAAALAARFDIDVRDEAFWTASLDVIRANVAEFSTLAGTGP